MKLAVFMLICGVLCSICVLSMIQADRNTHKYKAALKQIYMMTLKDLNVRRIRTLINETLKED